MKIGSNIPALPPAAEAAGGAARPAEAGVRGTGGGLGIGLGKQDTVTLSSAGGRISEMASSPDFDANKVEAIRQAIREGRFSVNAEAIADRLISEASALLGPRTH